MRTTYTILIIILLVLLGFTFFGQNTIELPQGETVPLDVATEEVEEFPEEPPAAPKKVATRTSSRDIFVTDDVKHSIPLDDILSGGPGKDGIPSIDDPKFITAEEGLETYGAESIGLGLSYNGAIRFYPYSVLVWHEIVNDDVDGKLITVTYCPLCMTGIVFDPELDGREFEFGVSGMLWQSNLLMYNRTNNENDESLWSQVLGEAVLGPHTGKKLGIIPADTVRLSDWIALHPDTRVLSQETGAFRDYTRDPYGNYYTNESVSFGATFSDTRLHPKAFVHGIEVNEIFKAYERDALPVGETRDTVDGVAIRITKNATGQVTFKAGDIDIPHIDGFWFSWLAVHPDTLLWTTN